MALYMDIHRNVRGIEKRKIDEAHKKDLAVQGKHGLEADEIFEIKEGEKWRAIKFRRVRPSKASYMFRTERGIRVSYSCHI